MFVQLIVQSEPNMIVNNLPKVCNVDSQRMYKKCYWIKIISDYNLVRHFIWFYVVFYMITLCVCWPCVFRVCWPGVPPQYLEVLCVLTVCVLCVSPVCIDHVSRVPPQYLEMLREQTKRPLRALSIMWAVGQVGARSLQMGLKGKPSTPSIPSLQQITSTSTGFRLESSHFKIYLLLFLHCSCFSGYPVEQKCKNALGAIVPPIEYINLYLGYQPELSNFSSYQLLFFTLQLVFRKRKKSGWK